MIRNKAKDKINLSYILSYILLIALGLTTAFSLMNYAVIIFAIFCIISYIFLKKENIKHKALFLFLVALIVRLLTVLLIKTPIISDFRVMYDIAKKIYIGDMSYLTESAYMNTWGYQMGHTMYQYFMLKIINSVLFLKIINCIVTSLIVVYIYKLSSELTNRKISFIISWLYLFFPFPLLLNTVLTNQHIPSLLIIISVYIIIAKKYENINYTKKYIIVALLLAIANVLRPESILIIISIIIYLLLYTKKKNIKETVKKIIILVAVYLLAINGASYTLKITGYSNIGLENKNPLWKFVTGLNHQTNGTYSNEDAEKYSRSNNETEKIEIIKQRTIDDIFDLPRLFIKKEIKLWTSSDLGWSLHYLYNKKVYVLNKEIDGNTIIDKMTEINKYFIYLSILLCLIGIFPRSNDDKRKILPILILGANFGVYLFIEVMARYAYSAQIFVYVLASIGLDILINKKYIISLKKIPLIKSITKKISERCEINA